MTGSCIPPSVIPAQPSILIFNETMDMGVYLNMHIFIDTGIFIRSLDNSSLLRRLENTRDQNQNIVTLGTIWALFDGQRAA